MVSSFIESFVRGGDDDGDAITGVAVAQVVDNVDESGQGRVQIRLPWRPGHDPWARVAVLMAGSSRGTFFIPQVDDEVLVAFEQGDIRTPFIIGCLWNGQDLPPSDSPQDATSKQIIKSRTGHQITIDDDEGSVTITNAAGQTLKLESEQITIQAGKDASSITLDTSGAITLQSSDSIELKAPRITIQGQQLDLEGTATASLQGGSQCSIQAALVAINS